MESRTHLQRSVALLLGLFAFVACSSEDSPTGSGLVYPETAKIEQTDTLHGVDVADPYRWLEEDVRESDRVRSWVESQNEVTFEYLQAIPERGAITARLKELWDFEKFTLPKKKGGRYFYEYNDGLQNQYSLYVQDSLDGEARLLIDPNTWSEDDATALSAYYPSPDGRFLAYTVQDGGTDWRIARVMDLDTGEQLGGELDWLKFTSLSWVPDGSGFYYARYPAPQEGAKHQESSMDHKVYFHRVGSEQGDDELIYARPDHPEWSFFTYVTDDGRYLALMVWHKGDKNMVVVFDREESNAEPTILIDEFEDSWAPGGNIGSEILFLTNHEAPNYRIVAIDTENPAKESWRDVIPEAESVLTDASFVGDHIIAEYLEDARFKGKVFDLEGELVRTISTPGIGTAYGFEGRSDDPETFYSYSSFNQPSTIYRYDVGTGESLVFKEVEVDFQPEDYVVEQVFFESKDGTRVPMFLAHKADLQRDGERPTVLYGYGGFNISQKPYFSISRLAWMEMGGVWAMANLRGGGEYGEAWHEAGTKLQKQNVFDDFIAAAEFLIAEGITRPERLAIMGGSNGGLLVGAVTNQRPDLFAAALPAVGVMDMLRFHLFTAGRFWVEDYGSADDPDQFQALLAYSPYHNIEPGTSYPAVLATTADTDDRVVPGHSFKYMAALQAAQAGDAPVLIRIETRAGHGSGKPTDKIIEEAADKWAFLVENLELDLPESY
jgi:prolyl oligopeptidase